MTAVGEPLAHSGFVNTLATADSPLTASANGRHPIDVRNLALTAIAVMAAILLLQYAQAVIIPIVLGLIVSYALDPAVTLLARIRVPRPIGAGLVLVAVVVTGSALLYALRFEAVAFVDELPRAARRMRQLVENDRQSPPSAIQQVQKAATEIERAANAAATPAPPSSGVSRVQVEPPSFNASQYLLWGSMGLAAAMAQVVLILFLVYFLLAGGDLYRRKVVKIAGPSLTKKRITLQILEQIDRQIERFLLVQMLTSAVVAVVSWLAFRAMGLEQAAVWGLLAGVFNTIPYFGPLIVTASTALVAFVQFGTPNMAMAVGGVALVITSLEGYLLTPWLTSRAARMNAVAIFVGLLFWGWVWNVWGMLLAVPMLMVIKAICDNVEDFKRFGELLGE